MESPCGSLSLKPASVLRDKGFSPRGSRAHVPQKAKNDNARHRGHVAKVSFKIKVSGTGERKMKGRGDLAAFKPLGFLVYRKQQDGEFKQTTFKIEDRDVSCSSRRVKQQTKGTDLDRSLLEKHSLDDEVSNMGGNKDKRNPMLSNLKCVLVKLSLVTGLCICDVQLNS